MLESLRVEFILSSRVFARNEVGTHLLFDMVKMLFRILVLCSILHFEFPIVDFIRISKPLAYLHKSFYIKTLNQKRLASYSGNKNEHRLLKGLALIQQGHY
ncbi:hypothetical protein KC19_7G024800 [Ceratodon purpureus]|uniref:Uncharacterized protein n=1 Tax=Ceratodon purpureus TaxID=3225 RepID=A0A8T0H226_CERPU|nr:hypothetical protein KC19_7G024800 [Ceratodon purpureus]